MLNEATGANRYTSNGGTDYTFTFAVYLDSSVAVYQSGVLQTINTGYRVRSGALPFSSVPDAQLPVAGFIQFLNGDGTVKTLASGIAVSLLSRQSIQQQSVYTTNEAFPSRRVEKDLDKAVMVSRMLQEAGLRALRATIDEPLDMTLPTVASRKNNVLGFTSLGLPLSVPLPTAGGGDLTLATVLSAGSTRARTLGERFADIVNVADYLPGGWVSGVTNSSAAIIAALAAATPGGAVYFPKGTYLYHRGTGSLLADTILSDNVTIYGDGPATIIDARNGAGNITNDVSNQFYNIFQATNRSGLAFRDFAFKGYGVTVALYNCTNVSISGVTINGLLPNAGAFLIDKGLYLHQTTDVRVSNNRFLNCFFAVYLSGDATTQARLTTIVGNHFEHDVAAGSYTATFPVGVYVYFARSTTIVGNTFRNIYSSVDSGTPGTGMGYAVYEGDGASFGLVVTGNLISGTGKGAKRTVGVLTSTDSNTVISGNVILSENGNMYRGILASFYATAMQRLVISGNSVSNTGTNASSVGVYLDASTTPTLAHSILVSNNYIGGSWGTAGVNIFDTGRANIRISGNQFTDIAGHGLNMVGVSTRALFRPVIQGNLFARCGLNCISASYTVGIVIEHNEFTDGNASLGGGSLVNAVLLTSLSYGSIIRHNSFTVTPWGVSGMTTAVEQSANASDRPLKDIVFGNVFSGMTTATPLLLLHTVKPVASFWDIEEGDIVYNTATSPGQVSGWEASLTSNVALTATASSASTTIVVASTAGYLAGDSILLAKKLDLYTEDYSLVTAWHATTVASVTNATDFVIADAIPAGDGTYSIATGRVKRVRWTTRQGSAATGSATYDPANLVDGAGATTTVTCNDAALGMYARAAFSLDLQGITMTAWVSAANTVSVRFQNESGGAVDLGSGTLSVSALRHN